MSPERELLKRFVNSKWNYDDWRFLKTDVEELLAQPEQEPLELAEVMRKEARLNAAAQFNEGLRVGQREAKRMLLEMAQVKQDYLNENEILTNLLLEAEDKIQELLAQPEQTPAAWITEWIQRYRYDSTPVMDRAVSFTKCSAPAVPNPNYIPLYTSPPTRKALSGVEIYNGWNPTSTLGLTSFEEGVKFAEKHHGIGETNE